MNPGGVGIIYRPIRVGFRRIKGERNCGETKYVMSSDLSVSISNSIEVQRSLTEDRTIWVMSCHVCLCLLFRFRNPFSNNCLLLIVYHGINFGMITNCFANALD
jgi:hypothetical protein